MTIAGGIREFARATPRATAVIDGDRTLTFAALDERASRLGQLAARAAAWPPGDRVAVLLGNRLEYPEVAAGIAKAGLVMVPLNPRLTPREAGFILEHSGARALVLDDALAGVVGDAVADLGLSRSASAATQLGPAYEAALAASSPADPRVRRRRARPVLHRLHVRHHRPPQGRGDLPPQPGAHVLPQRAGVGPRPRPASRPRSRRCTTAPASRSATRRSSPAARSPCCAPGTPRSCSPWCARDRVQSTFLVPTHAQMLRGARRGRRREARPVQPGHALLQRRRAAVAAQAVGDGGVPGRAASTSSTARPRAASSPTCARSTSTASPARSATPGSSPSSGSSTTTGNPVPTGEPGELFSRSPYLMNGYHDDPEATAACTTDGRLPHLR